ncbi:HD-GYP domain-containing protein [Paenibacillus alginolyticus]|uniref:HD-GYP domain-containing protein n=1 Tax=Paenibacillus alginolyticus TaxID=59839 RepID=UPI0004050F7C|nr:HD-GYP domain-containing protein [Paenibacillus alginolyticus]MCY9666443.1 HD-GYP domain-containing protein [Paenibacillus alginolyticus]
MDISNQVSDVNTCDFSESGGTYDLKTLKDIQLLIRVIEESDSFTWSHSINVANYAYTLAEMLCLSNEQKNNIYIGALLHDIGKIEIPETILKKTCKLTPEEWTIMKTHPRVGFNFLRDYDQLMKPDIHDIVLHHHERYDGNGYPDGLAGEEISLATRIVTVADCFDAMTSNRVYQNAKDKSTAAREILNNAYRQFDPQLARVFVDFVLKGGMLCPLPYQLQDIGLINKQKSS